MELTMTQRQAVTRQVAIRFRSATNGAKVVILDELCVMTGWRCWAQAPRTLRPTFRAFAFVGVGAQHGRLAASNTAVALCRRVARLGERGERSGGSCTLAASVICHSQSNLMEDAMSLSRIGKRLAALAAGLAVALTLFVGASAANAAGVGASFPDSSAGKAACEAWVRDTSTHLKRQGYTITRADCFRDQGWFGTVNYN